MKKLVEESKNEKKREPKVKLKLKTLCKLTCFFIYKFFQNINVFFPAVKLL